MSDPSRDPGDPLQPGAFSDETVIERWHRSAAPWTVAVRDGHIESRKLATNAAIIGAVMSRAPAAVLDLGSGEGWLARALAQRGVAVVGTDVVPGLVEQARAAGGGRFETISYEEIATGGLKGKFDLFDCAVCNFSLFGDRSVTGLFAALPPLLVRGGALVIQTVHPIIGIGEGRYEDGWREGSWSAVGVDLGAPAPLYFRTLGTWLKTLHDGGFALVEIGEPIDPRTGKPASIIFIGAANRVP